MSLYGVILIICVVGKIQAEESGCTADGKNFKEGEKHDFPSHCTLSVCKADGNWGHLPCGLVGTPNGWTFISEDLSKPYPDCCGKAVPPLDIVPDVLDKLQWSDFLDVVYDGNVKVDQGNELTPTQVKNQPFVNYTSDPTAFYTLCMTDPDAPSRQDPKFREFQHWLVGNIPGNKVTEGETISAYIGSGPPKGTGLHRYVFLLYKQPEKLTFDEPRVSNTSTEHRGMFKIRKLAEKYKLGDPVAINVYQAQYDDYVPILHKQLGFKAD